MQLKRVDAGDAVILAPAIGRPVGAAAKQPVQDRQEDGALEIEAMLAPARQLVNRRPATALGPEPLEHQARTDAPHLGRRRRALLRRSQNERLLGKARPRAQPPPELTAGLELVPPAERRDDVLAHLVARASALDNLQVDAAGGGLLAEVHRALLWCAQDRQTTRIRQQ